MNCARYHEIERLFTAWPKLEDILRNLSLDLNRIWVRNSTGVDDEYIYSLCIGNKAIDNMPKTRRKSDSTGNIAVRYGIVMRHDRRAVKTELTGDSFEISIVIDKLQLAFRRLSSLQREILALYYWEGKTLREITELIKTDQQLYGIRQVQEKRHKAIEKMKNIMKLPIETYGRIMSMVEERI